MKKIKLLKSAELLYDIKKALIIFMFNLFALTFPILITILLFNNDKDNYNWEATFIVYALISTPFIIFIVKHFWRCISVLINSKNYYEITAQFDNPIIEKVPIYFSRHENQRIYVNSIKYGVTFVYNNREIVMMTRKIFSDDFPLIKLDADRYSNMQVIIAYNPYKHDMVILRTRYFEILSKIKLKK